MTVYYFAVASQDFLLKEEPVEEILRERMEHYKSMDKVIDFWLIKNPAFLYKADMAKIQKQLLKPSAAIISNNPTFIDWLKLRLGFVRIGKFHASSDNIPHSLYSNIS
uniref:Ycf54 n=1 Tax=Balbiania investiens TaxID=111861 RepID=A0A4D6BKN5_9FLOR|nr:hypothetical protein [Balbiania investiens]QBX88542.1 hypothetical protein [Balbiania investiens]